MQHPHLAGLPLLNRRTVLAAGTALPWSAALAQAAGSADRVALVIGNAAYPAPATLNNPVNDARAMAQSLRELGFEVIEARDAGRDAMREAIAATRARLSGRRGTGLLYYAGHGVQLDWRNYMIPVDGVPASADDVRGRAVDVGEVVDAFRAAGNRMNIVVLDACRDNPFPAARASRGLAPLDAPPGTLLAYATAPGNVADDGDTGPNGLYTAALLAELRRPEARIEDVFKRVRLRVRQRSGGRQIPWESTSLEEDFSFATGAPQRARSAEARSQDEFLAEKAEWDRIRESTNADDFFTFLQKHPNGAIAANAQAVLEQLTRPQLAPALDRDGLDVNARPRPFKLGDAWTYRARDTFRNVRHRTVTLRVTAVQGDRVEFNGGNTVRTLDGRWVKFNSGVSVDPPLVYFPVDGYAVGKRWETRTVQTALPGMPGPGGWRWVEVHVAGREMVEVPAGKFQTFRIEQRGRNYTGFEIRSTHWVVPGEQGEVKFIVTQRQPSGGLSSDTYELVQASRG